ncbi:MAG: hypothetical protein R3E01_09790 [Pirellulaceae bacterium]|nr:hypothetical protein [Planctomycetales bacterium]
MICQDCGVEADTKHVTFYQNIGALVIRFPKSIDGNLCKSCVHRHFWTMTGVTLVLGWWGMISLIVSPFFVLNNVVRYVLCLGMSAVPPGAAPPELDDSAVQKVKPYVSELFERLNAGEDYHSVAKAVADKSGVTPGQVALFVRAVAAMQDRE